MSTTPQNSVTVGGPRLSHGKPKILVVDDEPAVRQFIETALRSGGYRDLLSSHSGSVVPSMAFRERPGLIIMDVMMPGGNGLRALRSLRQNPDTAGIPVIMTSGFNVPTMAESESSGMECLLHKPFTATELLKEVERILNARTGESERDSAGRGSYPPDSKVSGSHG
jgi:CheY-like chemotaxis protein